MHIYIYIYCMYIYLYMVCFYETSKNSTVKVASFCVPIEKNLHLDLIGLRGVPNLDLDPFWMVFHHHFPTWRPGSAGSSFFCTYNSTYTVRYSRARSK